MYRVQCLTNVSKNCWFYRVVYSCRCRILYLIAVSHVYITGIVGRVRIMSKLCKICSFQTLLSGGHSKKAKLQCRVSFGTQTRHSYIVGKELLLRNPSIALKSHSCSIIDLSDD